MHDEGESLSREVEQDTEQLEQLRHQKLTVETRVHIGYEDAALENRLDDQIEELEVDLRHERQRLADDRK